VRVVIRRRVFVSGRVQGVFFRDTCRREALAVGVTGWVRNCWDGRVEAVYEGDPDAVMTMINWSMKGPARAEVDDIEVVEEEPEGESGFAVR